MRRVEKNVTCGVACKRLRPSRSGNSIQRAMRAVSCAAFPLISAAVLLLPETACAAETVQIAVQGTIQRQCSVAAGSSTVKIENLAASGSKTIPLTVNCNAPFSYQLVSTNGGFRHTAATSAPGGFLAEIPYGVEIHIPTDGVTIDDACSSTTITSGGMTCVFGNSGNGVSIGRDGEGSLTLTWAPGAVPLSGGYYDKLELTVITSP